MKIESVKYYKNSATIVADGQEYPKLPLSEIIRFGIKQDTIIEDTYFKEFLTQCDRTAAKDYLFGLLSRGAKTEKEARIKLYQKGFRKDSVANALQLAKQYKYISDDIYADSFIQTNKHSKGAYRLKYELKQKGVPDDIIQEATLDIDEKEAAHNVGAKLASGKDLTDTKVRERLIRQLASRGFSYDTIKTVLSTLGAATDELDNC